MEQEKNKTVFIDAINAIKEQYKKDNKFLEVTREIDFLGNGLSYNWYNIERVLLKTLQALVGKPDDTTIEWWVVETDFGASHPNIGPAEGDFLYVLQTPEDLFNYLIDNTNVLKKINKKTLI